MQTILNFALYAGLAVLVIVLILGIINLARTDGDQPSRSNKLMRMRVIVQAVVVAILIAMGALAGSFSFGF